MADFTGTHWTIDEQSVTADSAVGVGWGESSVVVPIVPSYTLVGPVPLVVLSTTPVVVDVVDGDRRVLVAVRFDELALTELVHDGDAFTVAYEGTSSRSAIAGGYRYSILRNPIWPDDPVVRIFAFSTTGAEV
jgi:hypothetical protein